MPELQELYGRLRKYMFYLLSIYVLGWGFTDYQSIFLGLILGTSLSFFNLWLLVSKTTRFGEAVANSQKVRSLGMLTRMAVAVLGVMVVIWYPHMFHWISFVLGLMTYYIVIMIDFFLQTIRTRKQREER